MKFYIWKPRLQGLLSFAGYCNHRASLFLRRSNDGNMPLFRFSTYPLKMQQIRTKRGLCGPLNGSFGGLSYSKETWHFYNGAAEALYTLLASSMTERKSWPELARRKMSSAATRMCHSNSNTHQTSPLDLPTHSFPSTADFEAFLQKSHATIPGFYLKLAKKSSAIPSVSASEAVEIALCFGWIDGRANGLDENWWTVRYTPRRPKSMWSKKNVTTIARLIKDGRMRPAGIAAVEAAKADGRWDRAYAGSASIKVPEDLEIALTKAPESAMFFEGLNKTDRYSVMLRVQTASPQRRAKKIEALVGMLAEGKFPGPRAVEKTIEVKKARSDGFVGKKASAGKRRRDEDPQCDENGRAPPRRPGLRQRS